MKTVITVLLLFACGTTLADPLRDPMRPPGLAGPAASPSATAPPVVSAVFISNARRVAIVYGRLVRTGDRVGDCLVDDVVADGIRCHHGTSIPVTRTGNTEVAFRTPAVQSTVAANGEQK